MNKWTQYVKVFLVWQENPTSTLNILTKLNVKGSLLLLLLFDWLVENKKWVFHLSFVRSVKKRKTHINFLFGYLLILPLVKPQLYTSFPSSKSCGYTILIINIFFIYVHKTENDSVMTWMAWRAPLCNNYSPNLFYLFFCIVYLSRWKCTGTDQQLFFISPRLIIVTSLDMLVFIHTRRKYYRRKYYLR